MSMRPDATEPIDYEILFRAGPGGLVVTDADDTIVDVNDHLLIWTGFAREDLIGSTFVRLLPPADRILFSARAAPLLHLEGQVSDMSFTLLGKDRVARAAHLSASRVHGAATLFMFVPRRERSSEEEHLIRAVRQAERSDALRREAELDLEQAAQYDALTSLFNRSGLLTRIVELADDLPPLSEFSTFVLGLDHFRVVNGSLGRAGGDQVLKTVAERLMALSAAGFLSARVGDDEFVVVGRTHPRGVAFADTILESISAPILVDELDIVVTASLGASVARLDSSERLHPASLAETQMRQATTAMYEAKASGRNRWKLFSSVIDDSTIDEIRLLGEIRAALVDDQFRLEYQPQLDLATGELHGYEALLRWDHPERGVIGPADFIAVTEKSGLISQVGAWACRTAIEQCALLNREPDARPVTVSINVSARQLGDPRLAEMVGALVRDSGLDPALITLEITETGLITDSPRAHRNLELLHEQGVRLAIDDFGTGHAGFAYLKDFPVDELKIDGSFVAGLGVSVEDTAIVTSCIDVAHAVGMRVVAEGVETRAQLDRLAELGCDIIQGYLYSTPLHRDALQSFMSEPWR
jgi:diguanylate cyclase (GGDEF)-like protein/PAS domain S-box-containing protein